MSDPINEPKQRRGMTFFFFFAALIALSFTFYQSEILKYPPAPLLWYQRMMLMPILLISGISLWRGVTGALAYLRFFSGLGLAFAITHYLHQKTTIFGQELECLQGENCYIDVEWLGFITTPLVLALFFAVILISSFFIVKPLAK